ncbi:MAG: DUF5309 domain-containing protein [Hyphomicrobiales bacterium]
MAQVANTFSSYDSARNREEFADAIYNIDPEETPLMTLIGKEKVVSTHPEWSTDTLATPVTNNAHLEGDDFTYDEVTPTARLGNYTTIARKSYLISRTQEKTSKAGPRSELGRERRKKGVELRKDMEASILANQASVAGNDSSARRIGGLAAWLTTNTNRGSGGADGGFNTGTGLVAAATDGTKRPFTKAIMDDIILQAYTSGANPKTLMLSPYAKTVFSTFMSDSNVAAFRTHVTSEQGTLVGAADAYVSDFGKIDVVPNRVMQQVGATVARNAFLVDPEFASVGMFDDIQEVRPAKTGDAEKRVLITEYTLLVKNEKALAVAADLNGMNASS